MSKMPLSTNELKRLACEAIDKQAVNLNKLSQDIWSKPELAYKEHFAHERLVSFLEKEAGFGDVKKNYILETGFRAVHGSCEDNKPNLAVLCEYDALPEIGHACGHNLIAEVGVAAGIGIKAAMDAAQDVGHELGKVTILGTPAEEGPGGKIEMIRGGAFADVDAAMMCHPTPCSSPNAREWLATHKAEVTFTGKASHAAAFPWEGVNALDAAVMAYNSISVLRQQIKPTSRIHLIIKEGGVRTNIIPEVSKLQCCVRAPSLFELNALRDKVITCIEASGKATGCRVEVEWDRNHYLNVISNPVLESLYIKNSHELGVVFDGDDEPAMVASTDMGNVSYEVPSIHPLYYIGSKVFNHTNDFTQAAGSESAQPLTLAQGKALAMTAIDIYSQPELLVEMKKEHFVLLVDRLKEISKMPYSREELKRLACEAIDEQTEHLNKLSQDIWSKPELAYEEHFAHDTLTSFLEKHAGFGDVERSYVAETGFRAVYGSSEGAKPNLAVLCEYDALPEIGHACGHNLIAEVGVAAGIGIKAAMDAAQDVGQKLGKVTILGTPAEETTGGKIEMIRGGALVDVDAAMMCHPTPCSSPNARGFLGSHKCEVTYTGKASHAAAFPWEGVNALDAVVMAYNSISVLRQQSKPTSRIHLIIKEGGVKTNIIPEVCKLLCGVRAESLSEQNALRDKVTNCCEAAGQATGCKVEVEWNRNYYVNVISNPVLESLYIKNSHELGVVFDGEDEPAMVASTDMGNVSYEVPSIHPLYFIGSKVFNHTPEFTQAAGSETAQPFTLAQGKALAMTAIDIYSQTELLVEMKKEHAVLLTKYKNTC